MDGNGEKRWLQWIVRIILPALVAAQWLTLSGELEELRREVRSLREEVARRELEQDLALVRLETLYGLGRGQQGGGDQADDHPGGQ
jgi:hypothetical protein